MSDLAMLVQRFTDLPSDRPTPGIERRRVIGEQAMVALVTLQGGAVVAEHSHPNEQFAYVLSGELRFTIGRDAERTTVVAAAGDLVRLPGGMPHAAEALAPSRVLDVFAPPSDRTGVDAPGAADAGAGDLSP